jgi:hypothetical protein
MRYILLCLAAIACVRPAAAQSLPFSDGKWELQGERTRIETIDGRETIAFENGSAVRRDVRMQDGTIDLDVQLTRRRSFVGMWFRAIDAENHEEVYLRPHKSGLSDAVQYAPVFRGQSAWQLFHGPGGTAAVTFEPGAWTHVRLVVKGSQGALFIGDMTKPAIVMASLARSPAAGYIALSAFAPSNTPGAGPIARYADVKVQQSTEGFEFSSIPPPPATPPGVIRAWEVSAPFLPKDQDLPTLPSDLFETGAQRLAAEPSGLVLLDRFLARPEAGKGRGVAAARVMVRAEQAGLRRFDLGFSDIATVFLNGQPLYRGDAHYSFEPPRQDGVITFDQAALYLPLRAGTNELVVVVSDVFGGWGLQGRFRDMQGLTVEAR